MNEQLNPEDGRDLRHRYAFVGFMNADQTTALTDCLSLVFASEADFSPLVSHDNGGVYTGNYRARTSDDFTKGCKVEVIEVFSDDSEHLIFVNWEDEQGTTTVFNLGEQGVYHTNDQAEQQGQSLGRNFQEVYDEAKLSASSLIDIDDL